MKRPLVEQCTAGDIGDAACGTENTSAGSPGPREEGRCSSSNSLHSTKDARDQDRKAFAGWEYSGAGDTASGVRAERWDDDADETMPAPVGAR